MTSLCGNGLEFSTYSKSLSAGGKYNVDAKIVSEYKRITGNDTLPDYFVSASDIHYKDRIKVQSMLQRYIDASISSTINLPNSTTVEQVADIYMEAWKQGLKGVTIWRDGCQREGILSIGKKEDACRYERICTY